MEGLEWELELLLWDFRGSAYGILIIYRQPDKSFLVWGDLTVYDDRGLRIIRRY